MIKLSGTVRNGQNVLAFKEIALNLVFQSSLEPYSQEHTETRCILNNQLVRRKVNKVIKSPPAVSSEAAQGRRRGGVSLSPPDPPVINMAFCEATANRMRRSLRYPLCIEACGQRSPAPGLHTKRGRRLQNASGLCRRVRLQHVGRIVSGRGALALSNVLAVSSF